MCWTITPTIGATQSLGGGVAWRTGWETGLEGGFFWLGCRRSAFRLGSLLSVNVAQFHGDAKLFLRIDALAGLRFQWRLARNVYVGGRFLFAGRFVTDGRFPSSVSPNNGRIVKRYINFGFNIGPEVHWHVLNWLALTANLDYLFSGRHLTHDKFPEHRGQPMHALTLRTGVAFVF
ncbi:MAG: hypothetical protein KC609_18955 [Myxococcales bacterium]|nr:hypothetical protein [Myxococcales bacterium]